ncbi:MAG: hypothetical protein MOGMAGMI_01820 [Candidatus Omnitrophica bacterium]|nr:hypothetical protein [Candidatus Omnitrophota bacterium]
MKSRYFIIHSIVENDPEAAKLTVKLIETMLALLDEGYIIKSETATKSAVHYILSKKYE